MRGRGRSPLCDDARTSLLTDTISQLRAAKVEKRRDTIMAYSGFVQAPVWLTAWLAAR
jgi:hypothetical protein